MENKKYKDMSNIEIRKIDFENCPCKCTTCSEACESVPVGACREHLSKKFDYSLQNQDSMVEMEEIKMISANPKYITENDIEEVLRVNPKEEDLQSSFVTDGKYLYYVDGFTNPQEIRALSEEEQFQNLFEIAKAMDKTKDELISYMLERNKDVDYQNIPENDFETESEVDEWWKDKSAATIFKVYDEYYGIVELIAEI